MSRHYFDEKSAEKLSKDFLNDFQEKGTFQWDSNSSNEEAVFNAKSEILWSRENHEVSRDDFFQSLQGGFSELTEGSTSSCSWHNDDFDMNSSKKVKASLEAIEDALYEKQQSSLINETLFKECCDWSNKFPYFRLKGIELPTHDDDSLYLSTQHNFKEVSESSSLSLQVEGKKMAIHSSLKKTVLEKTTNDVNEPQNYLEEVLVDDGEYEEVHDALDMRRDTCNKLSHSQLSLDEEPTNAASKKIIEDKVIEKVALEIWPKVLEVLQKLNDTSIHGTHDDFQLPPIVSFGGQKQVLRRPRTEGTDEWTPDFPQLNSFLSISPKVLQNKREYVSWRTNQRSRPNSEIQLHRRNYSVPTLKDKSRASNIISQQSIGKQAQFSSSKLTQYKDVENTSVFLPAVNEDIVEHHDILKNFYVSPEFKGVAPVRDTSPKKSECFLPPIDRKNLIPSNSKLTRNLFTFFGPQLKSEVHNAERPATRPNTCASRKASKYSANLKHKLANEHSSLIHPNPAEVKKVGDMNGEKQVTLFPIVTSLLPHQDRNYSSVKKGFLNTFGGGRKR